MATIENTDQIVENPGVAEELLSCETSGPSKEAGGEVEKDDGAKTKRLQIGTLHDAEALYQEKPGDCTLILTEGKSAKSVVMAILKCFKKEDKDKYGVYALQGKVMNVRKAPDKAIKKNGVIQNLKTIIGLEDDKDYNETGSLRYKRVLMMTDPDDDGSHIKGLLINFFHLFWPALLKEVHPPFLSEFRKPSEPWIPSHDYFSDPSYITNFLWDDGDQDAAQKSIERAFGKIQIADRKDFFKNLFESNLHRTVAETVTITEFIQTDFMLYAKADLQRSIPSMLDGFKPAQRKVFFSLRKSSSNKKILVRDVSARVSEDSIYQHSEQCLHDTIIKMAQDFAGTNNLPLLQAFGQFGTRHSGRKAAGNARYLKTNLSPITEFLFPEADNPILDYEQKENNEHTVPVRYMPIIPLILVNGCFGVGTGWSTYVPNYKTTDIISNLEHLLNGEKLDPMVPWYQGFKGTIKKEESKVKDDSQVEDKSLGTYITSGELDYVNEETRLVKELPIRMMGLCTDGYIRSLSKMRDSHLIKDYFDKSGNNQDVEIEIKLCQAKSQTTLEENLDEKKKLGLLGKIKTTNMNLFDETNRLKRYGSPEEIIRDFYKLRIEAYRSRKEFMERQLVKEFLKLSEMVNFVSEVLNGDFTMAKLTDALLLEKVKNMVSASDTYEFILDLPTRTYTQEKLEELREQRDQVNEKIQKSYNITCEDIYANELKLLKRIALKIEQATEASNNTVEEAFNNTVEEAFNNTVEEASNNTVEEASNNTAMEAGANKRRARDESQEDEDGSTKVRKYGSDLAAEKACGPICD